MKTTANKSSDSSGTSIEDVPEVTRKAIQGEDEPMERKHPSATMGMVWFAYPLALVLLIATACLVLFYINSGSPPPA